MTKSMIIRAKTFRAWMRANFDNSYLHDITEHGCSAGFPNLTYYADTCKLYERFKSELWEMLFEQSEQFGNSNVFELLAGFNGAKDVGSDVQFENLVVWFAAEEIARELIGEV